MVRGEQRSGWAAIICTLDQFFLLQAIQCEVRDVIYNNVSARICVRRTQYPGVDPS